MMPTTLLQRTSLRWLLALLLAGSLHPTLRAQSTESRRVAAFDKIRISGGLDVELVKGSDSEVILSGNRAADFRDIITEVVNGELAVRVRDDNGWGNRRLKVRITTPGFSSLHMAGSGKVLSEDTWPTERMVLRMTGSGNVYLAPEVAELETYLSGSGAVHLQGSSRLLAIQITGSGRVEALGHTATNATIRISGSGDTELTVQERLETRISGSGSVRFAGDPSHVSLKNSGSGSVRKIR